MYRTKTNHNNTTHYARLNVPSKPPRDRGGVGGAARPPPRTVYSTVRPPVRGDRRARQHDRNCDTVQCTREHETRAERHPAPRHTPHICPHMHTRGRAPVGGAAGGREPGAGGRGGRHGERTRNVVVPVENEREDV